MLTQRRLNKEAYVIILAGGLASRLGKLTKFKPKSLIKINKKPFIILQLKKLEKLGFKNVILCLSHFSDKIIKEISKYKFNLNINFSFDGNTQLGTGGAIKNALKQKCSSYFFVVYGDVLFNLNLKKILNNFKIKQKKIDSLMVIFKSKSHYEKGNVLICENGLIKYDKFNTKDNMDFIDYGVSIFKKKTILSEKKKRFDLSIVQKKLSKKKKLIGYISKARSYEIGSKLGIKQINNYKG